MKTRRSLSALTVVTLVLLAGCGPLASGGGTSKTTTPTPTLPQPTDTTAPQQLTFVQDPMSAPDTYDWTHQGSCGSDASDGFHIDTSQVCVAPDQITSFSDGTVSIDARQTSGTLLQGYALIFRASGSGPLPDFYALLIDGNGKWRAMKLVNGQASFFTPFTYTAAIHRGLRATNTLKVVMTGSHFDLYVNGVKVGQFDDSGLATGVPGVLGGPGISVVFSNFRMQVAS
ncbi:MAG TPA: hypothetical protein VF808_20165 [Ktedonobacterales bacterium]